MLLLLALVGCRTKDLWDSAPVFVPDSTVDSRPDSPVDDTGCEQSAWYRDADSDGYGAGEVKMACDQPDGFVAQDGDCNDEDAAFHPGAPEEDCTDPEDYNCDGSTGYADADGDGYPACEDCDDEDATRSPGEEESCNGIDDDCDGSLPEEEVDDDGDGLSECEGDCDDTNDAVNPSATEICNGIDDDCEGSADGPDAVDASTWYEDADEDGFGSIKSTTQACEEPSGYTSDNTDCDDTDGAVNPDGTEVCDGVDNDCDGSTDDDGSWWDSNWPYRLPLTLTAASTDVEGPPVLVEVDFAAHLATLGASGTFDANSLRVVIQDCDLSQPELTSQFLDAVEGLAEQQDHAASTGDSSGTVAFLYDEDGDVGTLETLIASSTVEVALYFATSGTDPSYISKLSASTSALTNSQTSASFEASRGGLLDTLVWQGTQVSTQTDSC